MNLRWSSNTVLSRVNEAGGSDLPVSRGRSRENICAVGLLRIGGVDGACNGKRATIGTLGSIDFSIPGNRCITVIKRSNSNGDALLGVVNTLSAPASNGILVSNGSVFTVGSQGLAIFHQEGVNFVFRTFGLVPRLAIRRGVVFPLLLSCRGPSGECLRRLLAILGLGSHHGRLPDRLSNNRRREITVNHTLVAHPSLVLTSRPAKGLSSRGDDRIVTLLGRASGGCRRAVVVVARGHDVTRATSQMLRMSSNALASFKEYHR